MKEKLLEEVNEFLNDENPEELADILEVIYALCEENKIDIEKLRKDKLIKKGSFKSKIVLDEIK